MQKIKQILSKNAEIFYLYAYYKWKHIKARGKLLSSDISLMEKQKPIAHWKLYKWKNIDIKRFENE